MTVDVDPIQKYIATAIRVLPIFDKFRQELNEAIEGMETPEEKAERKKAHDDMTKFLKESRQAELERAYNNGFRDGRMSDCESVYTHFVVGDGAKSVNYSIKRKLSHEEFRNVLKRWGGS